MKAMKRTLSLGLASLLVAAVPFQAAASSPEFARTDEEWARLQDDLIEYDELAGLIQEYNATVQKNQIDFNEFRKEYGDSNEKVANRYRELADEIESSIDYPDASDASYLTGMMSIVNKESQVDTMREQADDAVEDSTIWYLTYKMAEDTLVSVAQSNMISYYQDQMLLEKVNLQMELQQENLQSAQARKAAGTATEVDVLNAQEALRSTEQTIQEAQSSIETVRQKLLVMLGWKHDANPQIGTLPEPDMDSIAALNPEEDKALALENNYTLKINKRKMENAKSADTKESLEKTIRENEQNIGASLTSNYQSVLSAKIAYELAVAQAELEQRNLQTASRNFQLGTISRISYVTQEITTEIAQISVQTAKLNLLQAIETYQWAVNGLASTS
ncbi:MAG: TolC family protein [Lachnospiraceae bacterium]